MPEIRNFSKSSIFGVVLGADISILYMAGQLSGSRQINVYVCLGVTLAAAVTTLILRLAARRITKISLWWDDYLAILAFVSQQID